ncbi:hypothetical protein ES703_68384 [subsurface metagenome]
MEFNPFGSPTVPTVVNVRNMAINASGIVAVACPVRKVRAVLEISYDGGGASGPCDTQLVGFSGPTVDVQFISPKSVGSGVEGTVGPITTSGTFFSGGNLRVAVLGD